MQNCSYAVVSLNRAPGNELSITSIFDLLSFQPVLKSMSGLRFFFFFSFFFSIGPKSMGPMCRVDRLGYTYFIIGIQVDEPSGPSLIEKILLLLPITGLKSMSPDCLVCLI